LKLYTMILVLLLSSCGELGVPEDQPGKLVDSSPGTPSDQEGPAHSLALATIQQPEVKALKCETTEGSLSTKVWKAETPIVIDGNLNEWTKETKVVELQELNAWAEGGLSMLQVATDAEGRLYIGGTVGGFGGEVFLKIKFGIYKFKDQQWSYEEVSEVPLELTHLSASSKRTVQPALGVFEAQLDADQVAAVTLQKVWGMRVAVVSKRNQRTIYETGLLTYESLSSGPEQDFMSSCTLKWDQQTLGTVRLLTSSAEQARFSSNLLGVYKAAVLDTARVLKRSDVMPVLSTIVMDQSSGLGPWSPLSHDNGRQVIKIAKSDYAPIQDRPTIHSRLYLAATEIVLRNFISGISGEQSSSLFVETLANAVLANFIKRRLSIIDGLDMWRDLGQLDGDFLTGVSRSDPICSSSAQNSPNEFEMAKARAAGFILGQALNWEQSLQQYVLENSEPTDPTVPLCERWVAAMAIVAPEAKATLQNKMAPGWLTAGEYHEEVAPHHLRDDDGDRLPNFLELLVGSKIESVDSDSDGWSDLIEYDLKNDGRSKVSHPRAIIADGLFGDWQVMAANVATEDQGLSAEACSPSLDIQYVAALQNDDHLVMAARLHDKQMEILSHEWQIEVEAHYGAAQWSAVLRVANKAEIAELVSAEDGHLMKKLRLFRPETKTIEAEIPLSELLPPEIFQKAYQLDVRFKLYKTSEGKTLCDESSPIKPAK
jgi:hypothetical protein